MRNVLFLIALIILSGCSGSSSNGILQTQKNNIWIQNANPGAGVISIVGDSLAYGTGATDESVKPGGCLTQLSHTVVANFAVPGYTSAQITNTLNNAIAVKPKLVFVSSGGNDTLSEFNTPGKYPEAKSLKEMSDLFDKLLAENNVVAYLGLNPPAPYAARLPQISQLAESKGVIVIDGMNGFWTDASLMSDQIHPNDAGYSIMCNRILTAITPYYP
jgi:lysophospholipase L1-like esterase